MSSKNRVETVREALFVSWHGVDHNPAEIATYLEAHGWEYRYEPSREEIEQHIRNNTGARKDKLHPSVWESYWNKAREQLLLRAHKEETGG